MIPTTKTFRTRLQRVVDILVSLPFRGTDNWSKTIAGFTMTFHSSEYSNDQLGILAFRHGSTVFFHSHPHGALGCPVCESGSQAEHDVITAQLIRGFSK
jgi:hypothetical protein